MRSAKMLPLPALLMLVTLVARSSAEPLIFHAETTKDTFLTYERVWVLFTARNVSDTDVAYNPLQFDVGSIRFQLYDQSGESVKGSEVSGSYYVNASILRPGASVTTYCALDRTSIFIDSTTRLTYLPAGSYTAEFRWQHVFRGIPPYLPEDYLVDSVVFKVVEPEGRDRQALEHYLSIHQRRSDPNFDWLSAFWRFYTDYADTPYGENVLTHLAVLTAGGAVPPPPGMSRPQVCKEFALRFPDNPAVDSPIERGFRMLDPAEGTLFLREILDSVPGTLAGQYAASLLSKAK